MDSASEAGYFYLSNNSMINPGTFVQYTTGDVMRRCLRVLAGFAGCLAFIIGCTTTQMHTTSTTGDKECLPIIEHPQADTVTYTVTFPEQQQRQSFIDSFKTFVQQYPFVAFKGDSAAAQVVIRLLPAPPEGTPPESLVTIDQSWFTESTIEQQPGDSLMPDSLADSMIVDTLVIIDTIMPDTGGKKTLFCQRSGIDGTFLPLVTRDPFIAEDSLSEPLFTVAVASPKKLTVTINRRVTDGTGRVISALDLIEAWKVYVKKHPAEGLALFRHVQGVKEFIQGREAVIRGFGAVDQKTCYLRLDRADPHAAERIASARLCGSIYSKLGRYIPLKMTKKQLTLVANTKTGKRMAYLDTLIYSVADDKNPILSFSLKKFDAITLTAKNDLSYARTTLGDKADLVSISEDRYFISCPVKDDNLRRYLATRVDAAELLRSSVKVQGKVLRAVESDSSVVEPFTGKDAKKPDVFAGKFRILFRKDDVVSQKIAEKLLADLSGSGMRCALVGAGITDYERALVENAYECAVGWVTEDVVNDPTIKLHLSTMWFQDERDESVRLGTAREIPLFTVERYLLMRKPMGIFRGKVENVYSTAHPVEPPPPVPVAPAENTLSPWESNPR